MANIKRVILPKLCDIAYVYDNMAIVVLKCELLSSV